MQAKQTAVYYRVPLTRPGDKWPKYRAVRMEFKTPKAARQFFEENIRNQAWFNPETCYIDEEAA